MINAIIMSALSLADPWTIETIEVPAGEFVEVGGIAFPDNDTIAVSTRRGKVWKIGGALDDDVTDARWSLFADGLYEGMGLDVDGDDLVVLQRGELSRLRDVDTDGVVDHIDVVTQDWGLSQNYHEFAFGLPRDEQGHRFVSLNLGFGDPQWWMGQSFAPYRGWILRVDPEGNVLPWAYGFRSPCGLGLDASGRLLVTDNQGDWVASSPIFVVEQGAFHGHPASLRWTEQYGHGQQIPDGINPPQHTRVPPAIWIPYDWSRSTGNVIADTSGGRFSPFEDQLFVAELTNGRILRAQLEEVDGTSQGAVWPFLEGVGSVARVALAPDGSLICGLTNRGWGGLNPGSGVRRIRWDGRTPLEMKDIHLRSDGFIIRFTQPIKCPVSPDAITVRTYEYNWWWEYGSPEVRQEMLPVEQVKCAEDGLSLQIIVPGLKAGRVARFKMNGITGLDGAALRTDEVAYTINRMPGGPLVHVAKEVSPPSLEEREASEEGWLRLTWGAPKELWQGDWRLSKAMLDPADRSRFTKEVGNDALVLDAPGEGFALSAELPTEVILRTRVMLPESGALGIGLPDGDELVLQTEEGIGRISVVREGVSRVSKGMGDAWYGPGQWHDVELVLEENLLAMVSVNGVQVLEDVPCGDPQHRQWLRLSGALAPGGIADVRVQIEDWNDMGHAAGWQPHSLIPTSVMFQNGLWGGLGNRGLALQGRGRIKLADSMPARSSIDAILQFSVGAEATLHLGEAAISISEGGGGHPTTGSIHGHDVLEVRLIPEMTQFHLRIDREGACVRTWINGLELASTCEADLSGGVDLNINSGTLMIESMELTNRTE